MKTRTLTIIVCIIILLSIGIIFIPDQIKYRLEWEKPAKNCMYVIALKGQFKNIDSYDFSSKFYKLSNPNIIKNNKGEIIETNREGEITIFYDEIWSNNTWIRIEFYNNKNLSIEEIKTIIKKEIDKEGLKLEFKVIDDKGNEYFME